MIRHEFNDVTNRYVSMKINDQQISNVIRYFQIDDTGLKVLFDGYGPGVFHEASVIEIRLCIRTAPIESAHSFFSTLSLYNRKHRTVVRYSGTYEFDSIDTQETWPRNLHDCGDTDFCFKWRRVRDD
jgi:hypothetical protein